MVDDTIPRTSVIIPTWNRLDLLRGCLAALKRSEQPDGGFEVIVVDNGSTDRTELELRRHFPWVHIVRSEINLGFGRACNKGILAARGSYLVLLNNDTVPRNDWLKTLVRTADCTAAGAIASKVVYKRNPQILNNAGSLLEPNSDWPVKDRGINEPDTGQYDNARDISAFCATAVLLKRQMLEQIGLFDHHFFMYWEDADLSWRAHNAGWKIQFEPRAIVEHEHAASSGETSDFFRYHVSRNRVLILAKHGRPATLARAFIRVSGAFISAAIRSLARGSLRRAIREVALLLSLLVSWMTCVFWVTSTRIGLRKETQLPPIKTQQINNATPNGSLPTKSRLRIAIYNPYLGTLGGGERLTVAIAEALCHDHDVQILARSMHGIPTVADLETTFGVSLPGVAVVDLDAIAGACSGKLSGTWLASARRRVADVRDYWLVRERNYDLFINNQFWSLMKCPTPLGIYICMFPRRKERDPLGLSSTVQSIAHRAAYTVDRVILPRPDEVMLSYSSVIAISGFTNKWLRDWWHIGGRVIYPPCRNWGVEGIAKRNIILSVGRFFPPSEERHDKRHDALIEAFAFLSLLYPDWELHLAGSCGADKASREYVEKLMAMAQGLAVSFHINAPLAKLELLYNQARIYWHATGYGAPLGAYPEREEHFGITTVEAMSAGAVPVVFPGGGQKEIVIDDINGYYWESLRQLVERTGDLINDTVRWQNMSTRAKFTAELFSVERFRDEFAREVARIASQTNRTGNLRRVAPCPIRS